MRVLLAFDKFKDSLSASDACSWTADVLRRKHRDWIVDICPIADGGEGFASILTRAVDGSMIGKPATNPVGNRVHAEIGIVPYENIPVAARSLLPPSAEHSGSNPTIAVIDMASASGLALLDRDARDPWQTSTTGTGELIRAAAEFDVSAILLGVGGSATHDLGLGALSVLGLDFETARGERVFPPIPSRWHEIHHIRGRVASGIPPIRIACDVTNPLLGACGAAYVYGLQKGIHAGDLSRLERDTERLARMLCRHCRQPAALMETPGAGAAGGIAFGFMTAAGAKLLAGVEIVSSWLDLETRLAAADVVVTGEGRFDDTSLKGKGPGAIAARAVDLGKRIHVFTGASHVTSVPNNLTVHTITPHDMPLDQALQQTSSLLAHAVSVVF